MGFDATRKLPGEGYTRSWPELVKMDIGTKDRMGALFDQLQSGGVRGTKPTVAAARQLKD